MFVFLKLRPEMSPDVFLSVSTGGLTWANVWCWGTSWDKFWRNLPLRSSLSCQKWPCGGLGYTWSLLYSQCFEQKMSDYLVRAWRWRSGKEPMWMWHDDINASYSGDMDFVSDVFLGLQPWTRHISTALMSAVQLKQSPFRRGHSNVPACVLWGSR